MRAVLLRGLVLRWIARHRLRAALGVLAVALGVAGFLASSAVAGSVMRTASAAATALTGGADLVLVADETGLPASLVAEVRAVPGVKAAAPLVASWVRIAGADGARAMVVGVDPAAEMSMRRDGTGPDLRRGVDIPDPLAFALGGAVVAKPLAERLRLAPPGVLPLHAASGEVRVPVAGTFEPPVRGPQDEAGSVVLVPIAAARTLLGRGDRVDRIDVTLEAGVDPDAAAEAIRRHVAPRAPPSLRVSTPGAADPTMADVLGAVDVALRLGALVALLVGMFLVHHTVAVGVTERRREIGILRALGATRLQVLAVFAAEAVVLGLTGAALGVALGWAVAATALEGVAATISGTYFPSETAPVEIPPGLALSGLAAGAVVALVAAWTPARRAAAEAPNDAIRRGPEEAARGAAVPRARLVSALAFAALAAAFAFGPAFPLQGYAAITALLAAFLAAAPFLLVLGARALAPPLVRVAGVPGRLAAEELARRPARAALPAAALACVLALVVESLGVVTSLSEGTLAWMEENVSGDAFVSSGKTVLAAGGHSPLDASLAETIRGVPGVAEVVAVRTLRVPWRTTRVLLLALDIAPFRRMTHLRVTGDRPRDAILADLGTGTACLVSENFAALHGTRIGDSVELPATDGVVPLRVAGFFPDYSWPRGTVLLSRAVVEGRMGDRLADQFSLTLAPGADLAAVAPRIEEALGAGADVVVTSGAAFRAAARELLADFFRLGYAQVAVALAVAFLGVLNGLWISVVLRRREIGLLRAAGATRGQVVLSVVLQAACLGALGAAFGVVGGLAVQWVALRRVLVADTGWVVHWAVPWGALAAVALLGTLVSALAGVLPARAAAATPLRDALGCE